MAKQLKKIRRNLKSQAGGTNTEKRPEKKGKDAFLLIMIALTFFIAFIGWSEMTWLNARCTAPSPPPSSSFTATSREISARRKNSG